MSASPDLVETVTVAAQLARNGSLPLSTGPRARKTEFIKRCQAALVRRVPLAELDIKKLNANDQHKIEQALDLSKHLCSKCPEPAATSVEFSLAWLVGIPEPHPDTRWFCKRCKPSHPAVCVRCGRHDTLVQEGQVTSLARFMDSHVIAGLRCSSCKTLAIAPMTPAEKRKAAGAQCVQEGASRKRMCE